MEIIVDNSLKWGNGIKEGTEGWDDGNTNNGDGCNCYDVLGYNSFDKLN